MFSIRQAATILNLSTLTIKHRLRDGLLKSVKDGGRRLIPAEAIDEYIERLKAEASA